MRTVTKYLILVLFLVFPLYANSNGNLKRGLFFRSYEVDKDKRTCLNLTPDKPLVFNEAFSMGFDLNLRHYNQNFGYIFRIISNDTLNIDFLISLDSETANFSLVTKKQAVIKYKSPEIGNTVENEWIKVLFTVNPVEGSISLSLNGIKKDAVYPFTNINKFDIYFGGNMHNMFSTTDIAPMTIKDIRLFDARSRLIRHWELDSHANNIVYDKCKSAKATVLNPQWEIDRHTNWSKRASFILPGSFYGMAFDRVKDRIFIAKDKNIFIYNTRSQKTDTIQVLRGVPFNTEFSQLKYDPVKDELISYQFLSDELATFNFRTLEWNNEDKTLIPSHYMHHGSYYIAEDSLLVTFAGYGFHHYNSVLYQHNPVTGAWESNDLSKTIAPRYLGCMGYLGDKKILYFGGFGNESGRQEEFPRNYYDLFSIDIENATAEKIGEFPIPAEHFTNSNSMVIDKKERKFYSLSYPNQRYASVIKLHEYSLDNLEYRVVGDTIPYYFNDVDSYCDLFLNSDSSELYSVVSYVKNNTTEIHIYSIAYPPLSWEEVIQLPASRPNVWIRLLPVLIAGLLLVFIIYRKKLFRRAGAADINIDPMPGYEEEPVVYDTPFVEKRASSVNLLGDFQVVDTDGNDITKNFTPTTTQLFLLLLVSTAKKGKGVTSQELRRILWYDKNDESARNNRNVYINKLRSILKSFGELKIINTEGSWTIQSEKNVFCDYEKALRLIKVLQTGDHFSIKLLTELVDIGLRGTLLPYIQQSEWLEPYQSDYANQLIECLLKYSERNEVKSDLLFLLKIADVIQLHDNIDEDAIRIKCYALYQLGRKNQALQAFNKFTADYEYLLAARHNLVFEELVV